MQSNGIISFETIFLTFKRHCIGIALVTTNEQKLLVEFRLIYPVEIVSLQSWISIQKLLTLTYASIDFLILCKTTMTRMTLELVNNISFLCQFDEFQMQILHHCLMLTPVVTFDSSEKTEMKKL